MLTAENAVHSPVPTPLPQVGVPREGSPQSTELFKKTCTLCKENQQHPGDDNYNSCLLQNWGNPSKFKEMFSCLWRGSQKTLEVTQSQLACQRGITRPVLPRCWFKCRPCTSGTPRKKVCLVTWEP